MNKIVILLFFLFPLLLFSQKTIIGDVDCSGKMDDSDLILITKHLIDKAEDLACSESFQVITPEEIKNIFTAEDDSLINLLSSFGDYYQAKNPPLSLRYFELAVKKAKSLWMHLQKKNLSILF